MLRGDLRGKWTKINYGTDAGLGTRTGYTRGNGIFISGSVLHRDDSVTLIFREGRE